ncbi:uncharacterized protein L969DRAFT_44015 [Mixia osmundae IAM 14324]|uniref:Uncharacterized protein n=1 Tax=Mixia osmundae (strain CBS 9802 / IAM 14324 / JCM 22182 / KY 12970) TaxID=764103 RepID=G7DTG5_MIXOS|nr:uncharacterized protein L969DRAFT_44015 [Mixia osmundae IAM 14324]KEI42850.1 hypothetical protein L969DRAFT_44015 [Mixia osmundae IAM 14324]GAA93812.1 hypothetical protein E5Q_00458 [Mixia osmundae IAM 14324]
MATVVYGLHAFDAENPDEISFIAGERIDVVERDDQYNDGWWQGRNAAGQVGLFPFSYTTVDAPTPAPAAATTASPRKSDAVERSPAGLPAPLNAQALSSNKPLPVPSADSFPMSVSSTEESLPALASSTGALDRSGPRTSSEATPIPKSSAKLGFPLPTDYANDTPPAKEKTEAEALSARSGSELPRSADHVDSPIMQGTMTEVQKAIAELRSPPASAANGPGRPRKGTNETTESSVISSRDEDASDADSEYEAGPRNRAKLAERAQADLRRQEEIARERQAAKDREDEAIRAQAANKRREGQAVLPIEGLQLSDDSGDEGDESPVIPRPVPASAAPGSEHTGYGLAAAGAAGLLAATSGAAVLGAAAIGAGAYVAGQTAEPADTTKPTQDNAASGTSDAAARAQAGSRAISYSERAQPTYAEQGMPQHLSASMPAKPYGTANQTHALGLAGTTGGSSLVHAVGNGTMSAMTSEDSRRDSQPGAFGNGQASGMAASGGMQVGGASSQNGMSKMQGQHRPDDPRDWTVDQVVEWGASKRLDAFTLEKLREHEITGDVLLELDKDTLVQMDLRALGPRMRLSRGIQELKEALASPNASLFMASQGRSDSGGLASTHMQSLGSNMTAGHSIDTQRQLNGGYAAPSMAPSTTAGNSELYIVPSPQDLRTREPTHSREPSVRATEPASQPASRPVSTGQALSSALASPALHHKTPGGSVDTFDTADEQPTELSPRSIPSTTTTDTAAATASTLRHVKSDPRVTTDNASERSGTPTNDLKRSSSSTKGFLGTVLRPGRKAPPAAGSISSLEGVQPDTVSATSGSPTSKGIRPPKRSTRLFGFGQQPIPAEPERARPMISNPLEANNGLASVGEDGEPSSTPRSPPATKPLSPAPAPPPKTNSDTSIFRSANALKQIGVPDHSGWMLKRGRQYNMAKLRYFVLKGQDLYYLKSDQERKIKGWIHLVGYKVLSDSDFSGGRFGFKILHESKPAHHFGSDDPSVIRTWMKALMKATISRDFSQPIITSSHIATMSLAEAQAMNPPIRPPSPSQRAQIQKAHYTTNPNTLTPKDAEILMSLSKPTPAPPIKNASRKRQSQAGSVISPQSSTFGISQVAEQQGGQPGRPTRRRPSQQSESPIVQRRLSSLHSPANADEGLIDWANSHLPADSPLAVNLGSSFQSGQLLTRLMETLSGKSLHIDEARFHAANNEMDLDLWLDIFDLLIASGVDVKDISPADVMHGDRAKISKLVGSIKDTYST